MCKERYSFYLLLLIFDKNLYNISDFLEKQNSKEQKIIKYLDDAHNKICELEEQSDIALIKGDIEMITFFKEINKLLYDARKIIAIQRFGSQFINQDLVKICLKHERIAKMLIELSGLIVLFLEGNTKKDYKMNFFLSFIFKELYTEKKRIMNDIRHEKEEWKKNIKKIKKVFDKQDFNIHTDMHDVAIYLKRFIYEKEINEKRLYFYNKVIFYINKIKGEKFDNDATLAFLKEELQKNITKYFRIDRYNRSIALFVVLAKYIASYMFDEFMYIY